MNFFSSLFSLTHSLFLISTTILALSLHSAHPPPHVSLLSFTLQLPIMPLLQIRLNGTMLSTVWKGKFWHTGLSSTFFGSPLSSVCTLYAPCVNPTLSSLAPTLFVHRGFTKRQPPSSCAPWPGTRQSWPRQWWIVGLWRLSSFLWRSLTPGSKRLQPGPWVTSLVTMEV